MKQFRIPRSMNAAPLDQRSASGKVGSFWVQSSSSNIIAMSDVNITVATRRVVVWSGELNRVLGGGIVPGSVVLLAGEPGIGKR